LALKFYGSTLLEKIPGENPVGKMAFACNIQIK
jgi:hypothetical protein